MNYPSFGRFTLPWSDSKTIVSMGSTSIGTFFTTHDQETGKKISYLVGDVINCFPSHELVNQAPKVYALDWEELAKQLGHINSNPLPNDLLTGGWFYAIVHSSLCEETRAEKLFREALFQLVEGWKREEMKGKNLFHDVKFW